jgi:hypothetical protein
MVRGQQKNARNISLRGGGRPFIPTILLALLVAFND